MSAMCWPVSLWAADWFWSAVDIAVKMAAAAEPTVAEDFIRSAILKEWLALSLPAGHA